MRRIVFLSLWLATSPFLAADGQTVSNAGGGDAEIFAVVEGFHQALGRGDGSAAMAFLASDAIILESGDSQTRDEYEREHLREDIEFAKAVPSTRSPSKVQREGACAWTTATSETAGRFKGRSINSKGTESMVLTHTSAGWRIRAIHWSSHAVRAK